MIKGVDFLDFDEIRPTRHCTWLTIIMEELSVLAQILQLDFSGAILLRGGMRREGREGT